MEFEPVLSRGPIEILRLDGPGAGQGRPNDLVIAFSSIGHDPGRCPSPEFVATAIGRGAGPVTAPRRALFVMDQSRSWGNAPDFAPALRAALSLEAARAPLGRVATIGQSMGAYCALIAAQILPVDAILAFSPQAGVGPGAVPGETRWSDWTARLPADLDWPRAPLPDAGRGRAWIFHGARDDLAQAEQFEIRSTTDHLLFHDFGHASLVAHLKARGALAGLLEAALTTDRRRLLRIAASAGGSRWRRVKGTDASSL